MTFMKLGLRKVVIFGRKLHYIYAYTVKMYDILVVKNTFVESVYYLMESSITFLL